MSSHAAMDGSGSRRVDSFESTHENDVGLFGAAGNVAELTTTYREEKSVECGGSASWFWDNAGAAARQLVPSGEEASAAVGLRVSAVEKK